MYDLQRVRMGEEIMNGTTIKFSKAMAIATGDKPGTDYEVLVSLNGFICARINDKLVGGIGRSPNEALKKAKLSLIKALELE
jgi:hypothetical protein